MTLHILSRSILLLINTIGIGLCFGAFGQDHDASFVVAGSFMATSVLLQPIFILWNKAQLRRVRDSTKVHSYEQVESNEELPKRLPGTKFLSFAIFSDVLGFLAYISVYGPTIADATHTRYWQWRAHSTTTLMAHGAVAVLVCAVIHLLLAITQALQLRSAIRTKRPQLVKCPHCHHKLQRMSLEECSTSSSEGSLYGTPEQGRADENLLGDTDPDARIVVEMEPGQVTGTCTRTPRVSESAQRSKERAESAPTANEVGEEEGDRLIEKGK